MRRATPPALAVADINADGHLDVLLGEGGGASLWYNDGLGNLSDSGWIPRRSNGALLPSPQVESIAVGDINQDGYVDVMLGTTLWLYVFINSDGTLDRALPEAILTSLGATGLGLGDVDGDGDLDLVVANGKSSPADNQVFRNTGGSFETQPAWVQAGALKSTSVVLGDVNGDGLVDAVFGNDNGSNRLYLGDAAALLQPGPVWEDLDPSLPTQGVALGDINGDGLFDLVSANGTFGSTMYLGNGTAFSQAPDWQVSAITGKDDGVALGDVDFDGDLDLAFARSTENHVYENVAGVVDTTGPWSVTDQWNTNAVAFADLDGDGDLELVGAGQYQPDDPSNNRFAEDPGSVYRNNARYFTTAPQWTRPGGNRDARDVDLCDVDDDGYLDVFFAHFSLGQDLTYAPSELYAFDGGTFGSTAVWTDPRDPNVWDIHNPPPNHAKSRSAAFGDYDGDGWADLLIVNGTSRHAVFRNEGGSLAATPTLFSPFANGWRCEWVDIRDDGFADIFIGIENGISPLGGPSWWDNPDGTLPDTLLESTRDWHGDGRKLARATIAVDIDNDLDFDFIAGGLWEPYDNAPAEGIVSLYRTSQGIPGFGGYLDFSPNQIVADITTGYFTDDDYVDFFVAMGDAPQLLVNRGQGLAFDESWISPAEIHHGAESGDVNGDGFTDVIAMRQEPAFGRSYVDLFLASGHMLNETPTSIIHNGANLRFVDVGDIDADGDLDIVTAAGHGADVAGDITGACSRMVLPANAGVQRGLHTPDGPSPFECMHDQSAHRGVVRSG